METKVIGKRGFYLDDLDKNGILLPNTPLLCRVKFCWLPTVPFDIVHPAKALYDPINCRYVAFPEVVGLREMCLCKSLDFQAIVSKCNDSKFN